MIKARSIQISVSERWSSKPLKNQTTPDWPAFYVSQLSWLWSLLGRTPNQQHSSLHEPIASSFPTAWFGVWEKLRRLSIRLFHELAKQSRWFYEIATVKYVSRVARDHLFACKAAHTKFKFVYSLCLHQTVEQSFLLLLQRVDLILHVDWFPLCFLT